MSIAKNVKKVVKKVVAKKEVSSKEPVALKCVICIGIGRVSEKVSCDTCQGTGLHK